MTRKVIIIAPKVVSDFLAEEHVDWDTQIPCENIGDMWQGLEKGELSQESDIVLILEDLFNETPEAFVEAIAMFAPYALVVILSYDNQAEIRRLVRNFAEDKQLPIAPFSFIKADLAIMEIEEIVHQYDHANDEPRQ